MTSSHFGMIASLVVLVIMVTITNSAVLFSPINGLGQQHVTDYCNKVLRVNITDMKPEQEIKDCLCLDTCAKPQTNKYFLLPLNSTEDPHNATRKAEAYQMYQCAHECFKPNRDLPPALWTTAGLEAMQAKVANRTKLTEVDMYSMLTTALQGPIYRPIMQSLNESYLFEYNQRLRMMPEQFSYVADQCYEHYLSQVTTKGQITQTEDHLMETIYCRLFIRCGDILRNLNLKNSTVAGAEDSKLLKYYICVRYVFKAFTPSVPAPSSDSALTTVWKGYKDCNRFNLFLCL